MPIKIKKKKKKKKGGKVFRLDNTRTDYTADWIRAARLEKSKNPVDKEKLAEMQETPLMSLAEVKRYVENQNEKEEGP